MTHGTLYAYSVRGCRCEKCRRVKARAARKHHHRKMLRLDPTWTPERPRAEHGTNSKYGLGCRCESCTEAHRLYRIEQNRRDGIRERVPVASSRSLVACMTSFGLERKRIAAVAGCSATTLRLKRETVIARTAERIADLHWDLFRNHGPFRGHCTCEWTPEVRDFMESEMVA